MSGGPLLSPGDSIARLDGSSSTRASRDIPPLCRGFPVTRFDSWQTCAAFCVFGLYWGNLQAQNQAGHTLGHVCAIGTDARVLGTRPYTTNAAHGFHTDSSDIAGDTFALLFVDLLGTRAYRVAPSPLVPFLPLNHTRLAALLCLRDAEDGGVNTFVSSVAVYNALIRRGRAVGPGRG